MKPRKKLVLLTTLAMLFSLGAAVQYQRMHLPDPLAIRVDGHPYIGQGSVEMVLFEDFLCSSCRVFSENVFPLIVDHFIVTGKARLVFVPIAFGNESRPLANATIAVYKMAPSRLLAFVLALFSTHAKTRDEILDVAMEVGGIDMRKLVRAMDFRLYYEELDGNLNWGKQLMGSQFGTPSLFVNGMLTSTASFDAVEYRIHQIEMKK